MENHWKIKQKVPGKIPENTIRKTPWTVSYSRFCSKRDSVRENHPDALPGKRSFPAQTRSAIETKKDAPKALPSPQKTDRCKEEDVRKRGRQERETALSLFGEFLPIESASVAEVCILTGQIRQKDWQLQKTHGILKLAIQI